MISDRPGTNRWYSGGFLLILLGFVIVVLGAASAIPVCQGGFTTYVQTGPNGTLTTKTGVGTPVCNPAISVFPGGSFGLLIVFAIIALGLAMIVAGFLERRQRSR